MSRPAPVTAPGPPPRDMLRAAPRMIRDPLGYLLECTRRYGDVVAFPVFGPPAVLVNDAEGVRRVLVGNARGYGKRTVQYDLLAQVTGNGLLVSDPPAWQRHRRLVQPAFHHATLDGVLARTAAATQRALHDWQARPEGQVVDADAAMMRVALDVVGAALFSTDLTGEAGALVAAVLAALDRVVVRARSPWLPPPAVPTPGNLRARRAIATIDATVGRMVRARNDPAGPGDDVLGMLLRARDGAGHAARALSERDVRDEVVTLLIAGHETVGSALSWALDLLAEHPDVRARVEAEADAVLAGGPLDLARLGTLHWTRAVLDETLRLLPPAWVLTRRALAPDTVAGVALPAGTTVVISPYVLHRHPGLWNQPERFRPQRWLDGSPLPRHAYLPFGAGPRLCIGRDFALVEATAVLALLVHRFRLERVPGRRPVPVPLVTVRPRGGLPLRLRHRRLDGPGAG